MDALVAKPLTVLLIEDNADDAQMVCQHVESSGEKHRVDVASSLREAHRMLDAETYDVVMLDLGLPDSAGADTMRKLHQIDSKIPVVVISGSDQPEVVVDSFHEGAQDYLIKGQFVGEMITRTLRHAIERYQILQALELERGDTRRDARDQWIRDAFQP